MTNKQFGIERRLMEIEEQRADGDSSERELEDLLDEEEHLEEELARLKKTTA